jgi:hypothetical protein
MRALLQASLNQFRLSRSEGGLGLDELTSDITLKGKPPAVAGDLFYSVHRGGVNQEKDLSDYRQYAIQVTISSRMQGVPWDRIGPDLMDREGDGLDDLMEEVAEMFQNYQYEIMNAANALIRGTQEWCDVHGGTPTSNGFIEPLRLVAVDEEPQLRSGSWWWAQPDEPNGGITLSARFGTARRVQVLGSVS